MHAPTAYGQVALKYDGCVNQTPKGNRTRVYDDENRLLTVAEADQAG